MRRPQRPQCRRPRSWYGLVDERTVRGRSPGSRVTEVSRFWTRVKVSFDTRAGCARSVLVTTRSGLTADHEVVAGGLARAQEIGVVDEVVEPGRTRTAIAHALAGTPAPRGRHGNIL
jgi:hypothetical protein